MSTCHICGREIASPIGPVCECAEEIEGLKRLLRRCLTPLRFASTHYLDTGLLGQEHRTDTLLDAIKRRLKRETP